MSDSSGFQVAISILLRIDNDLPLFADGRSIPDDTLDSMIVSLEFVYRELIVFEAISQLNQQQEEAVGFVRNGMFIARSISEHHKISAECTNNSSLTPSVSCDYLGLVGRPSYDISYEQFLYLIENRFSVPRIADMLGVSVRTIRRRMDDYGLSIRNHYSCLSNQQLDEVVYVIQQQFPMCGNRQMQGFLLSRGYKIQQSRIRETQRRVDPNGAIMRRLYVLNRREYSVPSPLSLYHIDGHHKLIRYASNYVVAADILVASTSHLCRYLSILYRWLHV